MSYHEPRPLGYAVYEDDHGQQNWYLYLSQYSNPTFGTLLGLRYDPRDRCYDLVHINKWKLKERVEIHPLSGTLCNEPMVICAVDKALAYFCSHGLTDRSGKEFCVRVVKELHEEYKRRRRLGSYRNTNRASYEEICRARPHPYRRIIDVVSSAPSLTSIHKGDGCYFGRSCHRTRSRSRSRSRGKSRDVRRPRSSSFGENELEEELIAQRDYEDEKAYCSSDERYPRREYYHSRSECFSRGQPSYRVGTPPIREELPKDKRAYRDARSQPRVQFDTVEHHHNLDGSYYRYEPGDGRVHFRATYPDYEPINRRRFSYC